MEGHLNELGYVEGEGEQSDWDDVDQQPPGDFNSVSIQFNFYDSVGRFSLIFIALPDTGHRMGNRSIVVGPTDGDVALAGHSKSHVPGVHGVQGHVPRVKSSQLCVTLQFAM